MTPSALQALEFLRKGSETFQWYVIPLLPFVFYVYTVEAEKRNWNLVLAGLAFWGMDWSSTSPTMPRSGARPARPPSSSSSA